MADALHIDVETRSTVDLRKTGAYVYFDDDTTDLWCAAYAFGDGPVDLWVPGEPVPAKIVDHIKHGRLLYAHNAAFERLCFEKKLCPKHGWPVPAIEQWRCTMAMCYALALPGNLEDACTVTRTPVQKDIVGARTMKQMAKPRKPRKDEPSNALLWWDTPEKLKTLYAYCRTDVEAERALHKRLKALSEFEQQIWFIDQKINDRGVKVDTGLAHAALAIVDEARERLDREMRDITDGEVASTSAVNQIKAFLRDVEGLDFGESLAKDQIAELLVRDDLSDRARRVLELRQQGSKTSVSKIDALLNGMQADGRSRGLLQYHAASTGRWGGRRFQPQNIKRPEFKGTDTVVTMVRTGNIDLVEAVYGDCLKAIGDTLRGMVCAEDGHRLIAADYSNVEGRVLAWLAGEDWKINAFREFDAGIGPDLYKLAYGRAFDIPASEVDKEQRQVGKVMELALGYQGGVGAFETMAAGYGVRIGDQYDFLVANAPDEVLSQVDKAWLSRGKSSGIKHETWVSAEIVKVLWRNSHPATRRFWFDMEKTAIAAVQNKESSFRVGRLRFFVKGSFLFMELPSARHLAYAFPKIDKLETPWRDADGNLAFKDALYFKGIDSLTGKWGALTTYGGKLVENACQAVARDLLAEALVRFEDAGYPTILTVHDEAMCEMPDGVGSVEEYEQIMSGLPKWADGLPLVAEGYEAERYRK